MYRMSKKIVVILVNLSSTKLLIFVDILYLCKQYKCRGNRYWKCSGLVSTDKTSDLLAEGEKLHWNQSWYLPHSI